MQSLKQFIAFYPFPNAKKQVPKFFLVKINCKLSSPYSCFCKVSNCYHRLKDS